MFPNALTMHSLLKPLFVSNLNLVTLLLCTTDLSHFSLLHIWFLLSISFHSKKTPNIDKTRIRVYSERAMSLDRHQEILGSSLKIKVIKVRQIVILFYLRFPRNNFDIVCHAFP